MIVLDGNSLTLDQLLAIAVDRAGVSIAPAAVDRVQAARDVVDEVARGDAPVYGVNTGFGSFAEVKIEADSLTRLQVNLLRSHAAGVGDPMPGVARPAERTRPPERAQPVQRGQVPLPGLLQAHQNQRPTTNHPMITPTGVTVTNLIKTGAGSLVLISNSLPATTLLDLAGGTLNLSQASTTSLTLASGQTIKGNGTLIGPLTATAGSTVSPGASVGILTVKGNVILSGTNLVEIDRTANTNDLLRATNTSATTITYGGTLRVVTLTGTIAATNTFKLFSATNYSGVFSSILPATPAGGLGWNTNTLATDGILRIVSTVNTTPTNITTSLAGNQLTLSWPSDHVGWRLQVQTNSITTGLRTNWVDVAGSTSVSNITVAINPANGSVFYRMVYP